MTQIIRTAPAGVSPHGATLISTPIERLHALLARAGADILADLPFMTDAELFGLYLFLSRLTGG